MKIHIFALQWKDEIRRSSQLRTLLKLVVVNRTWKKFRPVRDLNPWPSFTWMFIWTQFIDQLPVGLLAQLVERCTGIAEVMGSNPVRAWNFFQVLLTTTSFSSVLSCEDLLISTFLLLILLMTKMLVMTLLLLTLSRKEMLVVMLLRLILMIAMVISQWLSVIINSSSDYHLSYWGFSQGWKSV